MIKIGFLIKEELKSKFLAIAILISCIVFISTAVISAKEYSEMISEISYNSESSAVDWKRIEEHNLNIALEKEEMIKIERDKIKFKNTTEVTRYRIDNDIPPSSDQGTVKGFIDYVFFGEKKIIYVATIIIMFASLTIPFDRNSLYYLDSMGYNRIFFSKIITGLIMAIVIWLLNFLINYIVGVKNFGPYDGNMINYISGQIVTTPWKSYLYKAVLLSMTYPIFSAIIPMMTSSVFRNIYVSIFASVLIYLGIEPLRFGYFYPNALAKYTFIGNMYLLQKINGVPDLHLNEFYMSLIINIISIVIILTIAYFGYKRALVSEDKKESKKIQEI